MGLWDNPNSFFLFPVKVPIAEQVIRIATGRRRAIGLFTRKAEGIIKIEPTIVPIARPLAQEGVMYQSLIINFLFILLLGISIIYSF